MYVCVLYMSCLVVLPSSYTGNSIQFKALHALLLKRDVVRYSQSLTEISVEIKES